MPRLSYDRIRPWCERGFLPARVVADVLGIRKNTLYHRIHKLNMYVVEEDGGFLLVNIASMSQHEHQQTMKRLWDRLKLEKQAPKQKPERKRS